MCAEVARQQRLMLQQRPSLLQQQHLPTVPLPRQQMRRQVGTHATSSIKVESVHESALAHLSVF